MRESCNFFPNLCNTIRPDVYHLCMMIISQMFETGRT